MQRLILSTASIGLCLGMPIAQGKLGPRSFHPPEYTTEYYVDIDRILDTPIWEAAERSMFFGPTRTAFRRAFGFRFEDVKSLRITQRMMHRPQDADLEQLSVFVLEGSTNLKIPRATKDGTKITHKTIAEHPVAVEQSLVSEEDHLYVLPRSGCLVIGDPWLIRSVLTGKRRGGVMSGRLMGLVTKRRPLAYAAIDALQPDDPGYAEGSVFSTNWLSQRDPLQNLVVYLEVDEDTEQTTIRATMRFKNGREGPARLEKNLRAMVEQQKEAKFFASIKKMADRMVWKQDGIDLHVTVPLGGRANIQELIGGVGPMLPFFMLMPGMIGGAAPVAAEAEAPKGKPAADKPKPKPKPATSRPKQSKQTKK